MPYRVIQWATGNVGMHCVNAIPYVCRAEPGIRTYLDLPLVSGRHRAGIGPPS
jgi:hypothetical protein